MTSDNTDRPKLLQRSVIHIEIAMSHDSKQGAWQVLVSKPGVETMWTETWAAKDNLIDEVILAKIMKCVDDHVFHAIHRTGGVQMRLGAVD